MNRRIVPSAIQNIMLPSTSATTLNERLWSPRPNARAGIALNVRHTTQGTTVWRVILVFSYPDKVGRLDDHDRPKVALAAAGEHEGEEREAKELARVAALRG